MEKTIEWNGRKIVLFPIRKTGQFKVINALAHIIAELQKEGVDFTDEKGKKAGRSIAGTIVVIADRIEDDLDRIIDASTDDVSLAELQAGRKDVAKDFDDDLYWELVEGILELNAGKLGVWIERAASLQKKFQLAVAANTGTEPKEAETVTEVPAASS